MNMINMAALFAAFLCWGSTFVVFKIALETVPPVTLLLLRYLVAVPALFAILKLRGALRRIRKEDMPTILLVGFMGYFVSFSLQMLSVNMLTGSVSSLLGALNPVFIPILASVFLKERMTWAKIGCVGVCMTGVVIIIGVNGTADAAGVMLMLLSVFLWSATSIVLRRIAGRYDPMQVVMTALLCAVPFLGLWSAAELRTSAIAFPLPTVLSVLYMGTVGMAVPHSLWNYCLSKMDASFCSMFYPLQPLVSATLGVLILGEQMTASYLIGAAVICCGIVGAVRSGKKP
ncbi:MAG: DMT family transporter [Clostridia bacterium]|nr:DMT family transporter [Clostridia bacterium]